MTQDLRLTVIIDIVRLAARATQIKMSLAPCGIHIEAEAKRNPIGC